MIGIYPEWSNSPDDFLEPIHPRAWFWSFVKKRIIISNFQVTSHHHVLCVIGKCASFGLEREEIDESVSTYPNNRLKGSLARTMKTFPGTVFERTLDFLQVSLGKIVKLIYSKLIDEGLNCQQMFPIYPTIVPHATCCKWVIQIEAMVVKLNGLSTASCYPCQCISEMSSCTLLIRWIILQGWTCVHHLRQMLCRYSSLEFCFLDAD